MLSLLVLGSGCGPTGEEAGAPTEQGEQTTEQGTARQGDASDISGQALPANVEEAEVDDNVDGDTIEVVFPPDEQQVDVRLIGINAPESVRPNTPVECYGRESSERLEELLEPGTTVYLERDVSDTDQFDRLLRHVWIVDEVSGDAYLVSEVLVRQGYVDARTYPPDDRYADRLAAAERAAQDEGAGLWGACRD